MHAMVYVRHVNIASRVAACLDKKSSKKNLVPRELGSRVSAYDDNMWDRLEGVGAVLVSFQGAERGLSVLNKLLL
jgi:hypothetical protein